MNNILLRSLTGAVFISIILIPLFFSDVITTAVFGFFMAIGLIEFYQLFKNVDSVDVRWETGLFYGLLLFGITSLIFFNLLPVAVLVILIPLLFSLILIELWRKKENPIINAAVLVFGIIYVAIPFILMVFITTMDNNVFPLLAGMFILTWMNDTFAYLSGRFAGKTKLFERISPNKTWEGTIGGAIFTILAGIAVGYLFDAEHIFFWIIAALLIAPCAILGDLVESLFKRNVNVKDTGNIMPGHGGILDRFDATFFVVPFFLMWAFIYTYFA
jgi:phosphatidate cytidylyltransferase